MIRVFQTRSSDPQFTVDPVHDPLPIRRPAKQKRARCEGKTLLELLLSIAILSLLLAVTVSFVWGPLRNKMERRSCESNLTSLHIALRVYLTDHSEWPQMTEKEFDADDGSEEPFWQWWYAKLKPYHIGERQWMCPSDRRERNANLKPEERDVYESSYLPTMFESGATVPYEYMSQPWVIERGEFHSEGNLMIMPDGRIIPSPFGQF